jgi:xylulokinase
MHLIGLDIGTTGCKAALFDTVGMLIQHASREYTVDIPQPTWAEQDAEHVWTLAQEVLHELMSTQPTAEVAAIGLSVQGEAIIPVDAAGCALRPAILGMDTRTGAQNDWLRERFWCVVVVPSYRDAGAYHQYAAQVVVAQGTRTRNLGRGGPLSFI